MESKRIINRKIKLTTKKIFEELNVSIEKMMPNIKNIGKRYDTAKLHTLSMKNRNIQVEQKLFFNSNFCNEYR